ncbi:hypothetical protein [Bradyrhizobium sp. 195]|uniref:hypothetical protein n=1 Tax=Bradyrhizobium sp. 195 TaxID=2782662 RepID=UPI0020019663|nr:hypothetical protein [Bradyrhizobium sp. 195]
MVSEKILPAAKTSTSQPDGGASGDKIVEQYRRKVGANTKRLGRERTKIALNSPGRQERLALAALSI